MEHDQSLMTLDRAGVREVDRIAIEEFGVPGIVLMENASRALAANAIDMLGGAASARDRTVIIVCGSGNNGGDGYAMGRHLFNAGLKPTLARLGEPKAGSDAAVNMEICRRMEMPEIDLPQTSDLIVDALFGTGLDRPIEGRAAQIIAMMNASGAPILGVDVPSGLDCDTGRPLGEAVVRATRTVTFVACKTGFREPGAGQYTGEVVVAEIGAPRQAVERVVRGMRRRDG